MSLVNGVTASAVSLTYTSGIFIGRGENTLDPSYSTTVLSWSHGVGAW